MTMLTLTINGQPVEARRGQTVLEAASAAGIDIPTLCHHPQLKPIGACRICLVEIEKQRALQPACTFPVAPNLVVRTESPKVVGARKFALELLFSERNHFCMFCEMSGRCELQQLGYRYGLNHFMYPTYSRQFPVDTSSSHITLDHNRCVLCRRCLRACSELAANHTLDLCRRGAATMVSADMEAPLGQSSCIECGVCLDVCPTGALFDKRSAFMGKPDQLGRIQSVCSQCSLGCGIQIVSRNGFTLRIEGAWDSPVSAGLVCRKGRFDALYDNRRRIDSPLMKVNGEQIAVDWAKALGTTASRLQQVNAGALAVLTTTRATNEALTHLAALFLDSLGCFNAGILNKTAPALPGPGARLCDLSSTDCILIIGVDPARDAPVASFFVKRAVESGARLIAVGRRCGALSAYADKVYEIDDVAAALAAVGAARKPIIIYGAAISRTTAAALRRLPEQVSFLPLQPGVNTTMAASIGLAGRAEITAAKLLYIVAGEENQDFRWLLSGIRADAFVVVQTSHGSDLTERADVVLPMAAWLERSGHLTNTEGRTQRVAAVRKPCGNSKQDWEILCDLGLQMGLGIGDLKAAVPASASHFG